MTGQVKKQVFEIGLSDLYGVQIPNLRRKLLQAGIHVLCDMISTTPRLSLTRVLNCAPSCPATLSSGKLDYQAVVLILKQCLRAHPEQ